MTMIVKVYIAEWSEASRRNLDETLGDELRSAKNSTSWLRFPSAWSPMGLKSLSHVIVSLERLKPVMDSHNTQHLLPASEGLFQYSRNFQLGIPMGRQFIAISPDSIKEIAKGFEAADFDAIRPLYREYCHAKHCDMAADECYDRCVLPVLVQWKSAALEASSRAWGLLGCVR